MEHRRQAIDVLGLIAQLAGFIVLIGLFFPAVRRLLASFGFLAAGLLVLALMALIGFSVYRLASRQSKKITENPFAPPGDAPDPTGNDAESATANGNGSGSEGSESENGPDLLEPALRRRYPWRHGIPDQL
jgi:hypothetical protein